MRGKIRDHVKLIFGRIWVDIRKYWWVLLLVLTYAFIISPLISSSCMIYQTIGLPCAGCGMTRATRFVLTGQFSRAFYLNPMSYVVVLYVIYCLFFRYIKGKAVPYFIKGIIIIAILMILFYIVRMFMYFPDRVPYVYNYNNTLENIIPGYRGFVRKLLRF